MAALANASAVGVTTWVRQSVRVKELSVSVLDRVGTLPSSKPPIVLLHGLVSESDCYRRLMAALPGDRRVIAIDLPGSGFSDIPAGECSSFGEMAACVVEVCGTLGLDRPILLGHSHGGAISLSIAARHPGKVRALALMAPAHPYSGIERKVIRFYLSPIGRAFAHLLPRLPDSIMLFAFRHMPGSHRSHDRADVEPYLHTLRRQGVVPHILRIVASWNADMLELATLLDANSLALPTLLVWGERDVIVPAWSAQRLVARLTDTELLFLPGIGHLPNDEVPEDTALAIGTWLDRVGC